MRVLQIGADRSKRGILYRGSPAFKRQEAYAKRFGQLDIIALSLRSDKTEMIESGALRVFPTSAVSRLLQMFYAVHIARALPKPDVVSAQDPFETGLVAWVIARLCGSPLHIQVHTDFFSSAFSENTLNRIRVRIARFILKRAERVRAVSEHIARNVRGLTSAPVTVLPIYADIERIRNAAPDAALRERYSRFSTRLLVVARLEPEKNVGLAIEAFAAAPQDACLIIVGEGSEFLSLRDTAKRLNVSDRVFFEEGDVASFYTIADLVLVPSKYEGYGLVIIEALAAGKPVLATDVGIAREAGAIITSEEKFADSLREWFERGPRNGTLKGYPYANFDEYVEKYCADIERCVSVK